MPDGLGWVATHEDVTEQAHRRASIRAIAVRSASALKAERVPTVGVERFDVGIGFELLLRDSEARIDDRIGVARPCLGEGVVARRIDWVGGDVIDPPSGSAPLR